MSGKFLFKIVLAGSGGCGKTSFVTRFTTGQFKIDTKMTIGVDFAVHYLNIPERGTVTLQIWDFGGEERFRTMLPSFCLGASGCLLFFDLMRPNTFYELDEWIQIIRNNTKNASIILLGSKYDLLESPDDLAIKTQDIIDFIKEKSINGYLNVSSKSGLNVKKAFEKLTRLMLK
ncbi:MAG: GTP-binding protein [Candidatus Lokiarchaeota archaeon]|nr:GTP-binding protein [Candidatus Lokiarchaeota archaeon]